MCVFQSRWSDVVFAGVFVVLGLGCVQAKEFDQQAKKELEQCPELPSSETVSAPPGQYVDQGATLDYDKLVPMPDPRKEADLEYGKIVIADPRSLEQIYYDASRGNDRAAWLICYLEVGARGAGRNAARHLYSLQCRTVLNCEVAFDALPFSAETASGVRTLEIISSAFRAKATKLKIAQDIIAATLSVYVGTKIAASAGVGTTIRGNKGCFVGRTLVHTTRGRMPIEAVRIGDRILSRDKLTSVTTYRQVVETYRRHGVEVIGVVVAAPDHRVEIIETTAEHPLWVVREGWAEAARLEVGDQLGSRDGETLRVIDVRRDGRTSVVYNIRVEKDHTFFVGNLGTWVHNKPMDRSARIPTSRVWPKHHPFPKYLGGAPGQTLKKIPRKLHYRFHSALDKWMNRKYARTRGTKHFENMDRETVIRDLREFYKSAEGGLFRKYLPDFERAVKESARR